MFQCGSWELFLCFDVMFERKSYIRLSEVSLGKAYGMGWSNVMPVTLPERDVTGQGNPML